MESMGLIQLPHFKVKKIETQRRTIIFYKVVQLEDLERRQWFNQ